MAIKKVQATVTIKREYFLTELYPSLTDEQRATLELKDIQEDFKDLDFFDQATLLEDSEASLDIKVEEVNE